MKKLGAEGLKEMFEVLFIVLKKLLIIGVPTIAAINGHTIAGGFVFALTCDFRFMRDDSGIVNMPEIDMGVIIPRLGHDIIRSKLNAKTSLNLQIGGAKYTP